MDVFLFKYAARCIICGCILASSFIPAFANEASLASEFEKASASLRVI